LLTIIAYGGLPDVFCSRPFKHSLAVTIEGNYEQLKAYAVFKGVSSPVEAQAATIECDL